MKLPQTIREQFVRYGRTGGHARAQRLKPEERRAIARRAASCRWIRERFGALHFETLGLPGGDLIDAGLSDLATDKVSVESLLVSLAAPRLRREGVPVGAVHDDPESRLFHLLSEAAGDLAHARYQAHLLQVVSFANACRGARIDLG